jgi:hypothetical protein
MRAPFGGWKKNGWDVAPGNVPTLERILNVFEKRGVEFIDGGVRLMTKKPRVAK